MGLFDLFSSGNERAAANDRIAGLQRGYDQASGAINTGLGDLRTAYGQAQDYYTPLAGAATGGFQAYSDATGANGQAGLDRARTQFTQTPGYQQGLSDTLDQLQRRQASLGMLGSGNTLDALAKTTTDYANRNYGDYVSRLSPFLNTGAGIAGAQANLATGLGNQSLATGMALGNLGYNTQTGIGNANAAYELSKDQTGMNQLNGILGGLKLAGQFAGFKGF